MAEAAFDMSQLPQELVDAILQQCVAGGPKQVVLNLRLVCRAFDRVLKPYACRTLQIEFSRLSRASRRRPPSRDALQTIGYHCRSMYIDLMLLRDELEVEFLDTVFAPVPSMQVFCRRLQKTHCMNDASFTETDYRLAVDDMLFNCRLVDRLKISLPYQLVGIHCNAGTMVLAITFMAFARRPEEDSSRLETLVIENLTDVAICSLWTNPCDVHNIMAVVSALRHLVLTIRRLETEPHRVDMFSSCLWDMIRNAEQLRTLCILGMDHEDRPPARVRTTHHPDVPVEEWRARALPGPQVILANLTCLELKRVDVAAALFRSAAWSFGATLQELFLNEVCLKVEESRHATPESRQVLWVGLPNRAPPERGTWVAALLRESFPDLRVCRAAFLAYDVYLGEGAAQVEAAAAAAAAGDDGDFDFDFDVADPCRLGRGLAQRFVEVVMGLRQPPAPDGTPVEYRTRNPDNDRMALELQDVRKGRAGGGSGGSGGKGDGSSALSGADGKRLQLQQSLSPPRSALSVTEHDANAYQSAVENTTSRWLKSIDGIFPNCNRQTLEELHRIAETACSGMNELSRQGLSRALRDPLDFDDDDWSGPFS